MLFFFLLIIMANEKLCPCCIINQSLTKESWSDKEDDS